MKNCEISNICRFCLCQHTNLLMPLSKRIDSAFTIHDIELYTGIQIPEDGKHFYAICETCCTVLEKSTSFRWSCLNNDIVFNQLFSTFVGDLEEEFHSTEGSIPRENKCTALEIEIVLEDEHIYDMPKHGSPKNNNSGKLSNEEEDSAAELKLDKNGESVAFLNHQPHNICSTTTVRKCGEKENEKANGKTKKKKLCGTCGVMVYDLISHVRIHAKEKCLTCSLCPIKMANRANLLRHIQAVHVKKILKSCELCGKGFTSSNSYKSHMRSHHGIGETYDCEICSKSFNHPSNYKEHFNRLHNIKKDYKCRICGKLFKDRTGLKGHRRVHSSSKPFACNQCPKGFKSLFARNSHQLTHSGIRFSCALCEKSYQYKRILTAHYRKHHPDVEIIHTTDGEKI